MRLKFGIGAKQSISRLLKTNSITNKAKVAINDRQFLLSVVANFFKCFILGNYYALAYKAAIPKSTLLNIIHGTNPTIETIQKICGGFDISLGTFFNTDYFYEIYDDE